MHHKLSPRLMAIAGFIGKDADVADIGTDHGYLPVYLAQKGLAHSIIASDISANSLKTALDTAAKYGVADKISFIAAPGLSGVTGAQIDTIVIAGMGGETISRILAEAAWTKCGSVRLILQPQTKIGELYKWLHDNDYAVSDARLAREKGRYYVVMLAGESQCTNYKLQCTNMELISLLAKNNDPLLLEYIDCLISKVRRVADGMASSGAALNTEAYAQVAKRLEDLTNYKLQIANSGSR